MSAPELINRYNQGKYNNDPDDAFPVKAGFWNNMIKWALAMFPALGSAKIDTISEYTSGSGIEVDGLLIKDGKVGQTVAITANATGIGSAIISSEEQHVIITSTNANHIVSLPLLSSVPTGANISGTLVNTGCELRVNPDDISATKYINGVTGGNEMKVNGGTGAAYFQAVKQNYARWIVKTWSSLGAPTTLVPDK
jgi:hypothetical protein